jgi:FlaG/FlaF family flagellin (archaellin)
MVLSMTLNCSIPSQLLKIHMDNKSVAATAGMVSIAAILGAPITVVATGAALISYYALTDKSSKDITKK